MNTALGCTMARKFKDGYYYCQLRGLICPTHKGFSKDEMTVDCCCEGSHLCNHDMNSYHAFHLLPMLMKVSYFFL